MVYVMAAREQRVFLKDQMPFCFIQPKPSRIAFQHPQECYSLANDSITIVMLTHKTRIIGWRS